MRILVFSWRDPKHPLAGGAEQVMHEHMKGWINAGHSVTLFSSGVSNLPKEDNIDGVLLTRSGFQYLGVQFRGFLFYIKNEKKYDLVIDQFHGLPFFTPLYVKKPILAVIQETAREVWFLNPLPFPLNIIIGTLGYLIEPSVFLFYKKIHFITGSESASTDIQKFGISKDHIHVVPHGVLVKMPSKSIVKERIWTLIFLGALAKDKGVEEAIKCFAILNKKDKFHFWIVGKGETAYVERLKKLIKDLEIENVTTLFGFVPENEKVELLAKAHLFINPSAREGWGLVNIEANVLATPVIAYNSAGLIDSIKAKESGIICSQNSPEQLAKETLNLLRDNKMYKKMQSGAINWSQKFSWEKSKQISLKLVEEKAHA